MNIKIVDMQVLYDMYKNLHGDSELENQETARQTYNAIFNRDDESFLPLHMYESQIAIETEILERIKLGLAEIQNTKCKGIARNCETCFHKNELMSSEVCKECSLNYARWVKCKEEGH